MNGGVGLPGEQQLLDLVNVLVDRHRGPGVPDETPIVTLWAPRGCGLAEAVRRLDRPGVVATTAPVAVVEAGQVSGLRPHEVALRLTWPLGGDRAGFGRITFPRFFLGLTVVRAPAVQGGPDKARKALIEQIVRDRTALRSQLGAAAALLAAALGVPGLGQATRDVVEAVVPILARYFAMWSAPVQWYETAPTGVAGLKPVDQLTRLAWLESIGDRDPVESVLCAAFAADITAALDNAWGLRMPRHRPLVAFPSSASEVLGFLETLPARWTVDSPLTVLAASEERVDGEGVAAQDWTADRLVGASLERWKNGRGGPGWSRRYPLQTGTALEDVPQNSQDDLTARKKDLAELLAHGHAGGMAAVRRALTTDKPSNNDPRKVLLAPGPGGDPLDDEVLTLLLRTWPGLDKAVVRLALLRDLHPDRLGVLMRSGLDGATVLELVRFLRTDMWVLRPPGGDPRLHPFARRAITHRVGRGAVAGVVWASWHDHLGSEAYQAEDAVTYHYHQLAVGRVTQVADHLAARLGVVPPTDVAAPDIESWYAELLAITRAPTADPGRDANASAAVSALLDGQPVPTQDVVRPRLVAALQMHSDVLGDPHHELCRVIAQELIHTGLAPVPRGTDYLLERAEEFTERAIRRTGAQA